VLIIRSLKKTYEVPGLKVQMMEVEPGFIVPKDKHVAYLDADKVKSELIVRRWEKGDKFVPFGMTGKKKVSDYLTDRKFTIFDKENQWVVCDGKDIVWLMNERTDNRYRVTKLTRKVIIIKKDSK
jgi:tRNA(Ile)-lysidine synthase